MRLICIEEHATDAAIDKAARPGILAEAPYFGLMDTANAASAPRTPHRPTMVALPEALELAADLGDGRIKHMDEQGIDMQVVSFGSIAQLAPADQSVALTRAANNRLAAAIAANPDRLSGFAVLPWQDPQAAAAELDRSVSELGLKGVLLIGRPGATFLDDPKYAPVLKKLSDLNVPLYAHPGIPLPDVQRAYYTGFSDEVSASGVPQPFSRYLHMFPLIEAMPSSPIPSIRCGPESSPNASASPLRARARRFKQGPPCRAQIVAGLRLGQHRGERRSRVGRVKPQCVSPSAQFQ
jgi:predicted TIM-barrel fold metal-dependent hydrolase